MDKETKAPMPDEVKDAIYQFRQTAKEFGINDLDWFTSWKTIRVHIAAQAERISKLEAENKRLRDALAPFAMAALKYRDIGDSPVADYIRKKTGLIAGYNMVFMPLCSASTSPKHWFEAADALAQPEQQFGNTGRLPTNTAQLQHNTDMLTTAPCKTCGGGGFDTPAHWAGKNAGYVCTNCKGTGRESNNA